jgi:hypothetical protein
LLRIHLLPAHEEKIDWSDKPSFSIDLQQGYLPGGGSALATGPQKGYFYLF